MEDTINRLKDPLHSPTPVRRRTKIVCTIGPACNSEAMIHELMLRGMNVARLNFSHGTHEEHARVIVRLRKMANGLGRTICILQDLQGPKIRTGRLKSGIPVVLRRGRRSPLPPRMRWVQPA